MKASDCTNAMAHHFTVLIPPVDLVNFLQSASHESITLDEQCSISDSLSAIAQAHPALCCLLLHLDEESRSFVLEHLRRGANCRISAFTNLHTAVR